MIAHMKDFLQVNFPRYFGRPLPSAELVDVYESTERVADTSKALGAKAEQLAKKAAQIGDIARRLRSAFSD